VDQIIQGFDLAGKVGNSIRDGYALTFSLPADSTVQRLEVRARRIDLNVIAPMVFLPPR
jgi:hypothetical protein